MILLSLCEITFMFVHKEVQLSVCIEYLLVVQTGTAQVVEEGLQTGCYAFRWLAITVNRCS